MIPTPASSTSDRDVQEVPRSSIDWGRSRDMVLTAIGVAVLLYIVGLMLERVMTILIILVFSVVVAFILEPLVGRLERRGVARGWAAAASYSAFLMTLGAGLLWVGGSLAAQFNQLNTQLPGYAQTLQDHWLPDLQQWLLQHGIQIDLNHLQMDAATTLQSAGADILGQGLGIVTGVTDTLFGFMLVVVISFYLVLDGQRMRDILASLVPSHHQRLFAFLERSLMRVVGGYIRGQLLMATIIGLCAGLGSWLMGVQYPLVLGLLGFFFELIPMVGPVLTATSMIGVSLFQPFPLVIFVIGFCVVMMLIEGQVLVPRIVGQAVGLHPMVAILALISGAELAGLWGALFAMPLVGLAAVLGIGAYNELNGRPTDEEISHRKA